MRPVWSSERWLYRESCLCTAVRGTSAVIGRGRSRDVVCSEKSWRPAELEPDEAGRVDTGRHESAGQDHDAGDPLDVPEPGDQPDAGGQQRDRSGGGDHP